MIPVAQAPVMTTKMRPILRSVSVKTSLIMMETGLRILMIQIATQMETRRTMIPMILMKTNQVLFLRVGTELTMMETGSPIIQMIQDAPDLLMEMKQTRAEVGEEA